ncbi:syntaxin-binding protein 5 isoform X2 [Chrysoperla carnea]|uniref:syntaxin-binding protein 5 isoform X2 n=1 Tax=Chrysoperla carnea TaxID=189513 RepID=UPI001D0703BF|nr:syntaxin-binding protein 5 isoform X2 [Chrysoperla carnea]
MKRGDKDRKDMKKFTFKGVLDGFRSSVQQSSRPDQEIHETLRSEHFDVKKTFRHGFPFQPTAIAFDPVQKILAIGSKCGSLRLLGRPGVDAHAKHESPLATAAVNIPGAEGPPPTLTCGAVLQIQFLVNEGALVTATADDSLHLWNFRQKVPQVVQSLKFQRERITCLHLPLQSKWLYVGTERGNIHVVNIETFQLSGYIINWNKAIELTRKTHPGPVLHLSDNPADPSKILIGYESGQLVLWDLRTKMADCRWQSPDAMRSAAWHYEGKQFMSSHVDGSLITWTLRQPKPINVSYPHAKTNKDGKLEQCKAIQKVEWKSARSGEPFVIFSGGMANDKAGRTPSITVVHCKTTTVLEMEHNVVDFITLCESPWISDLQEPYAIVVLLHNDLVVIDLQTTGFPCIENPYPMDIHESPVTCCSYLVDCPADLIPAFYSVGTHNRAGFSKREWPINGGEWSSQSACSYSEIIITGHADGSVKFWDASAGTLQVLYKLKTAKVFDKQRPQSMDSENEDPFAVQLISLCPESRKLCVAGAASYVVLFKFKKTEAVTETTSLEIPIIYDIIEEGDCSPECEYPPLTNLSCGVKTDSSDSDERKGNAPLLKVRPGPIKKPAGFQAQLVCLTPYHQGQPPGRITALAINSSYGLMAYGNESGLVIVDIVQKVCLLNIGSPDLYGAQDPYSRAPRSPKRGGANDGSLAAERESSGQARSPSIDQVLRVLSTTPVDVPSALCPTTSPSPVPLSSETTPPDHSEEAIEELIENTNLPTTEEEPNAQPSQSSGARRKSVSWKTFNLKRQLSRVDMKLKSTFAPPPERDKDVVRKLSQPLQSNSVFYTMSDNQQELSGSGNGGSDESNTINNNIPRSLSPVETSECSSETVECDAIEELPADVVQLSSYDNSTSVSPILTPELCPSSPTTESIIKRPDNLELHEVDQRPIAPPRFKRDQSRKQFNEMIKQRDQRLLSVPNIKYTKQELIRDLRHRDRTDSNTSTSGGGGGIGQQQSFAGNLMRRFSRADKLDSSFSRSRSSSMSSLENISSEAIQCLAFADSYSKKSEPTTSVPTLWVGTSLGSVLSVLLQPPEPECRSSQPCLVSICGGPMFRLKGSILTMSFLDCNGALIPYTFETWRDENKERKDRTPTKSNRPSPTLNESRPNSADGLNDRQFVVIASEKQARVVALPSQTCIYRQQICDTDFVVKAEIVSLRDSVCLACYVSSGKLLVYSLPSLRPLVDTDFLPLADLSFQTPSKQGIIDPMLSIWGQQIIVNEDADQIAKTFCFSNRGHGLFLSSPSELQKFTLCSEFSQSLNEMMGDLFLALDMPEAPKESFFRGWFGGATRNLDREELFGEASGKALKTVAKHIPGPNAALQDLNQRATSSANEISRAHQLMLERGDKLSQLEERTARMAGEAESFSGTAHNLMLKYKDKKWYQL